jgi:hypothetical protein
MFFDSSYVQSLNFLPLPNHCFEIDEELVRCMYVCWILASNPPSHASALFRPSSFWRKITVSLNSANPLPLDCWRE